MVELRVSHPCSQQGVMQQDLSDSREIPGSDHCVTQPSCVLVTFPQLHSFSSPTAHPDPMYFSWPRWKKHLFPQRPLPLPQGVRRKYPPLNWCCCCCSVAKSCLTPCMLNSCKLNSWWAPCVIQQLPTSYFYSIHRLQHARLLCPSPSPGVCSNMSIELVMLSNHLILCCPLLHLPSVFLSTRLLITLHSRLSPC